MKTRILVKEGEYQLSKAFCMDPKIDAQELYCYLTGLDKVSLFLKAEEEVDPEIEEKYMELIRRRAERIPLQHITGVQEFMGYTFKVNPHVLIPRQDTETLVTEAAKTIQSTPREKLSFFEKLKGRKEWDVLDLCCGSGAVGISLAKICSNVKVTATDISAEAVETAEANAEDLRVKVRFLTGDMFEPVKGRKFDMIVSNPPYIRTNMISILQEEVKDHEPLNALDGGRDGLDFYRTIVEKAADFLKPEGFLLVEIGHDQGEDLRKMLKDSGKYSPAVVIKDLPGRDRVVKCKLK
ncbi:Release factor glutamine methyltransferase [uncultured Eubacterium sp.]|uniref:peptide chain release factor N(5)-glutamine methyltransferase n=1 Tax=Brotomerdimonas butyrica TaxID=2981721 RepID=UPI000822DBBE|nr:peptide chain release factor N(5)-glutamine methyltransferase [Brotomerdimonas butyrica]MCU6755682.1 peptide chain release factor N(5)-glutamine methyltransferase [Brotomerdimonas butyrica]SCH44266.1 Release factor glutamine methyltransferase [uncultured Eubacterium sp.]